MGSGFLFAEMQREGIPFDASTLPSGQAIIPHLQRDTIAVYKVEDGYDLVINETIPGAMSQLVILPLFAGLADSGIIDPDDFLGMIGKMLTPADVQAKLETANQLKQVCLAALNYEATNGRFPTDIVDDEGKPLLSWRVQAASLHGRRPVV